jgi:hypothetical protein
VSPAVRQSSMLVMGGNHRIAPSGPSRQHNILNPAGAGANRSSLGDRATYPIGPYVDSAQLPKHTALACVSLA